MREYEEIKTAEDVLDLLGEGSFLKKAQMAKHLKITESKLTSFLRILREDGKCFVYGRNGIRLVETIKEIEKDPDLRDSVQSHLNYLLGTQAANAQHLKNTKTYLPAIKRAVLAKIRDDELPPNVMREKLSKARDHHAKALAIISHLEAFIEFNENED